MSKMNVIKKMLHREMEEVQKLKKNLEDTIKGALEGTLIVSQGNHSLQYFHKTEKNGKKGSYLGREKEKLVARLAQKDYDIALYKAVIDKEKKIEKVLKYLKQTDLTEVYDKLIPSRKRFVQPPILNDSQYAKLWLSVEYVGNPYDEEGRRYETERGEMVRSKSEKIIADKLYKMGIPYRYEYPYQTRKNHIIYPDFTLLHSAERKEMYLEHFGMMDNPEYCNKALIRLQELARDGVVLGKNLFATFESSVAPLDTKTLDFLVQFAVPELYLQ